MSLCKKLTIIDLRDYQRDAVFEINRDFFMSDKIPRKIDV